MQFLKKFGGEIVRLVLFAVALSAVGASGQVWKWSQTPGNNATADPHINWAEGMAPSAVNDSARAMMAGLASYRDDISGLLVPDVSGTATAYVLTTNQGLSTPTPPNGQMISFRARNTNGVGVTLSVDGGTAYPIQSGFGVGAPAGTLIAGSPYTLIYSTEASAWLLRDVYGNPYGIALGMLVEFTGTTPPNSNFVLPYGQCISRTTYAAYFAMVGTTYGACDGTTTFAVIDKRGVVSAGVTTMGGADRGNLQFGNTLGAGSASPFGNQKVTLAVNQLPNYTPSYTGIAGGLSVISNVGVMNTASGSTTINLAGQNPGSFVIGSNSNTVVSTGSFTPQATIGSINGGVSQQQLFTQQPTVIVNYLLRII